MADDAGQGQATAGRIAQRVAPLAVLFINLNGCKLLKGGQFVLDGGLAGGSDDNHAAHALRVHVRESKTEHAPNAGTHNGKAVDSPRVDELHLRAGLVIGCHHGEAAEDYKAFWRLTVEKFNKYCPKAQILWCYCPNRHFKTEEQYLLSYPGDDIVDILAYDDYQIGDAKNVKSEEELREVVLKRARLVSGIASRLNKPLMIAESNCRKEELKDVYFDIMQEILTDKEVHISIVQLWSMSYYKNQTIEFVQNKNIIFNK